MKHYVVPVTIDLYADSPEMAREEIRQCLKTGRGHIEGWKIDDPEIIPREENKQHVNPTIYLTCGYCGGKEYHGQGENGPCPVCKDSGKVLVERKDLTNEN